MPLRPLIQSSRSYDNNEVHPFPEMINLDRNALCEIECPRINGPMAKEPRLQTFRGCVPFTTRHEGEHTVGGQCGITDGLHSRSHKGPKYVCLALLLSVLTPINTLFKDPGPAA